MFTRSEGRNGPAKRNDLEPDTDGCNGGDDGGEDGSCEADEEEGQ